MNKNLSFINILSILLIILIFNYIIKKIFNKENFVNKSNLYIVINTCKNYYKNIPGLIDQIVKLDIPVKNVIIVSGQEEKSEVIFEKGIKIVKVKYTGLHLTSFIYLKENNTDFDEKDYFIMLPDTIKFGNNFYKNMLEKIKLFKNDNISVLPFINPKVRPTMDMGIVNKSHLNKLSDYLDLIKTYNLEKSNLKKLKRKLIVNENTILGLSKNYYNLEGLKIDNKITPPNKFIINNNNELKEKISEDGKINEVYFKPIDLYKYQRNFRGLSDNLILDL